MDGLVADGDGLAIVVIVGAVVGVFVILLNQAGGKAVGEFGELLVVAILCHQRAHGLLVLVVVIQDAVDKFVTFEVVIK